MPAGRSAPRSKLIASAFVTALALVIGSTSMASAGTEVSGTPLRLLQRIERKAERPSGYDRALFVHWIDQDGDGCDARREVLIAETREPLAVGSGFETAAGGCLGEDAVAGAHSPRRVAGQAPLPMRGVR